MINHLKLIGHKGIKSIVLNDLGQINVICGKNNSGKSSILEAMTVKDKFGIGKSVDDSLKELFKPQAARYSSPDPTASQDWFNKIVDVTRFKKEIWYESDTQQLVFQLQRALHQDPNFRNRDSNIFDFHSVLNNLFKQLNEDYKPYLIPPKRTMHFEIPISTGAKIDPTGEGIINRLFYLKNQDIKSADYELYKLIYDEFEFVTGSNFNIIPKMDNKIELKFNNINGEWVSALNSGLGLSDVLIILSQIFLTDANVFLIEEPESHLHAEYQKKMLNFIKRQNNKQFFLATHSNVFLDPVIVDKIIYTEYKNTVTVSDVTSRSVIISALGYSIADNLSSDIIILTEGTTDVPIIKEILTWKGLDLLYNIKFWPLGGDMMTSLDLDVLAQDHELIALIDSDFQSKQTRDDFISKCQSIKVECFKLERYAIENYLSIEAIRNVFGKQVPSDLSKLKKNQSIKSQIGFNIKSKNYQIIKNMTIQDFQGTDLLDFCDRIEKKLKKNVT